MMYLPISIEAARFYAFQVSWSVATRMLNSWNDVNNANNVWRDRRTFKYVNLKTDIMRNSNKTVIKNIFFYKEMKRMRLD